MLFCIIFFDINKPVKELINRVTFSKKRLLFCGMHFVGVPANITAADLTAHFGPHHQLDKLEPARKDPERQRGRRRRVPLSCLGISRTKHLGLAS